MCQGETIRLTYVKQQNVALVFSQCLGLIGILTVLGSYKIAVHHRKVGCLECDEGFKSSTKLQMHLNNDRTQKNNQEHSTKKLCVNCSIYKKYFKTFSKLCDYLYDAHVKKENGSDCYDDNFQTWLDMFQQDHQRLMELDDSSSNTE